MARIFPFDYLDSAQYKFAPFDTSTKLSTGKLRTGRAGSSAALRMTFSYCVVRDGYCV